MHIWYLDKFFIPTPTPLLCATPLFINIWFTVLDIDSCEELQIVAIIYINVTGETNVLGTVILTEYFYSAQGHTVEGLCTVPK